MTIFPKFLKSQKVHDDHFSKFPKTLRLTKKKSRFFRLKKNVTFRHFCLPPRSGRKTDKKLIVTKGVSSRWETSRGLKKNIEKLRFYLQDTRYQEQWESETAVEILYELCSFSSNLNFRKNTSENKIEISKVKINDWHDRRLFKAGNEFFKDAVKYSILVYKISKISKVLK